jgi:hypothetical protein
MQKLRIGLLGFFGSESAHFAVSRRPPISLSRVVARTEGLHLNVYDANVGAVCLVQGACFQSPNPKQLRIDTEEMVSPCRYTLCL